MIDSRYTQKDNEEFPSLRVKRSNQLPGFPRSLALPRNDICPSLRGTKQSMQPEQLHGSPRNSGEFLAMTISPLFLKQNIYYLLIFFYEIYHKEV